MWQLYGYGLRAAEHGSPLIWLACSIAQVTGSMRRSDPDNSLIVSCRLIVRGSEGPPA